MPIEGPLAHIVLRPVVIKDPGPILKVVFPMKTRLEIAVNFGKVRGHLLAGHDVVVCGHVHRAARYAVDLPDDGSGEFITLGEWGRRGSYLEASDGELNLRKFS